MSEFVGKHVNASGPTAFANLVRSYGSKVGDASPTRELKQFLWQAVQLAERRELVKVRGDFIHPKGSVPNLAKPSPPIAAKSPEAHPQNPAPPPVAPAPRVAPGVRSNSDSDFAHHYILKHGPTHFDDLARAFALSIGKQRAGAQIKKRLGFGLFIAAKLEQLEVRGEFVWPAPGTWKGPTESAPAAGKVLYRIPPQQIANAACDVMHQALPNSFDDLVAETIRSLGFRRVEKKSRSYVEKVLKDLHIDQDFERQSAVPEPPSAMSPPAAASAPRPPSEAPATPATLANSHPPAMPRGLPNLPAQSEALLERATATCPDQATATTMNAVLRVLLASSGRAGVATLSFRTGIPAFRIPGLIAKLSDCLPSESRDLLRFDHGAKEAVLDVVAFQQNLGAL
ncbi:MAG: hypothetical protein AB7K71_41285 [Polyangiaceae bacterium]